METRDSDVIYRPLLMEETSPALALQEFQQTECSEMYREGIVIPTAHGDHTKIGELVH